MGSVIITGPDGRTRSWSPADCLDCGRPGRLLECHGCHVTVCEDCARLHGGPGGSVCAPLSASAIRMVSQFREGATIGSAAWLAAQDAARRLAESSD